MIYAYWECPALASLPAFSRDRPNFQKNRLLGPEQFFAHEVEEEVGKHQRGNAECLSCVISEEMIDSDEIKGKVNRLPL